MKKKLEREENRAKLGTVIIILAMVIIFGAIFVWMYKVDMLFLPDFIEEIIGRNDDDEINLNMGELSELVKSGKDKKGETVTFELTYDNLREAFLTEEPAEGLYVSAEIAYYNGDARTLRRAELYRNGDMYRSEICYPDGSENVETLKIADAVNVTVIDTATGEMYTLPRAAGLTPENETGIPSVDAVMTAVAAFPERLTEASETESAATPEAVPSELSECDIKMVRTENGNVYYVSFIYTDIGVREEYFISLSYGTVISAKTYVGEALVYSYDTLMISLDPEVYTDDTLYTVSESK